MSGAGGAPEVTCEAFDESVDELAVGTLLGPERATLLAHATSCPACEAKLNELAGVADRLLLLAPEEEPPDGFSERVLARLDGVGATNGHEPAAVRRGRGGRRRWLAVVAAVAAALVLVAAGIAVGRATRHTPAAAAVRSGEVVTPSGKPIGVVQVSSRPVPSVVMAMYGAPGDGVLDCELSTPQGRAVVVGSWDYRNLRGGVWAAGIDRSLTDAVMMRLLDQKGTVVATAALTPGSRA